MKLYFIGAAHEVTGSCTLLSACGHNILIDCGMEQGGNVYENVDIPVAMNDIDALFLTHAHIDHSGDIPLITANGFKAPVYTTEATAHLCRIMLLDSAHIQEFEASWQTRKNQRNGKKAVDPLYTRKDAEAAIELFESCDYDKYYKIFDGIEIRFTDVGHLLGSACIEIKVTENGKTTTLLFSGDVGNYNRPLVRDPHSPPSADIVVIESTYGDRLHDKRPDYVNQIKEVIQSTFDAGGNVVIPSFAVGRTQELLYLIRIIKEQHMISGHDNFNVFVDSPLAVEATGIYSDKALRAYFDDDTLKLIDKGINPIKFPGLRLSVTSDDSKLINTDPEPKVILSASGMCEAGRIRHHLKYNLWRPECTVLFVGYQAEETLGRKLIDGATEVKLFGDNIHVAARIEKIDGISGHSDRDMLINWLKSMPAKPNQVFVNHGHDTVCDEFAKTVNEELGVPATAPYSGDGYEISDTVKQVDFGPRKLYDKKAHISEKTDSVYYRLLTSGKNLMSVIEQNKGCSNKDMAKFADQIAALCEKYKMN